LDHSEETTNIKPSKIAKSKPMKSIYKSKKEKIQSHYQVPTTEIIEEEDNITDRSITPRDKNDYYTD